MSTPEKRAVGAVPAHLEALRIAKILDHHLARKAIVYVRQSSPQQVAEHKESAARQYALVGVEGRLFRANGVNQDLDITLFAAEHGQTAAAVAEQIPQRDCRGSPDGAELRQDGERAAQPGERRTPHSEAIRGE